MRLLILGGNGMIGHKMYQILSRKYTDTWVIIRKKITELPFSEMFNKSKVVDQIDLIDLNLLKTNLEKIQPDVIINAAGITIRRGVNDSIAKSIIINSALPHKLDEWVTSNNKKLIHFSTDCVFSGKSGFYSENSYADANDIYGRTKFLGEVNSYNSLTLRGSMIGRELENKTELLEWFLKQKNKQVKGFNKVMYSGITTCKMAEFVSEIIDKFPKMHGLYNVSSEKISKYDLIKLFNTHFEINADIVSDDSYVSNKDLNSDKFYQKTGFKKPKWPELIEELNCDIKQNKIYYG